MGELRSGGLVYMAIGLVFVFAAWRPNSPPGVLFVRPRSMLTLSRYWNATLGVILVVIGLIFFLIN